MNRRFEDEMLEAAFGDVTPEQAAEIQRQAMTDPEAAKAFSAYRRMRDDLAGLRDIPEHQLSTERLRHAILEGGLKPKSASNGWNLGWLWAPATAAAIVFAFTLLRTPPASEPNLIVDNTSSSTPSIFNNPEKPIAFDFGHRNDPEVQPTPNVVPEIPVRERIVRSTGLSRRGSSGSRPVAPKPSEELNVSDKAYTMALNASQAGIANTLAVPVTAEPSFVDLNAKMPRNRDDNVIVIQPDRDLSTGANKATEVTSNKNVVIGG